MEHLRQHGSSGVVEFAAPSGESTDTPVPRQFGVVLLIAQHTTPPVLLPGRSAGEAQLQTE
ncbi:hypothetical protein NKJ55_13330 [Mesorhizobium sp. M0106]|uniref:hypothetical protein n=1 Tax=Mesorhizobium sp. M0106 TaxID=2956880 RepID=UPI00333C2B67